MLEVERREFFRIEDDLPIEYRKIEKREFDIIEKRLRYEPAVMAERKEGPSFYREDEKADRKEGDHLLSILNTINRKLDIVIELLYRQREPETLMRSYQRVNISGSGIRFVSEIELKVDDLVELRIILPLSTSPKITSLCRVTRSERVEKDGKAGWLAAMNFDVINEAERDLLINYIFARERELIRHKKETGGQ